MQHCDSHWGNFLYHKIKPGGFFHYKIIGVDYYIENIGYLWVIWDFGLSRPFSQNMYIMSDDIYRILTAFLSKKHKGWLTFKDYDDNFSKTVLDIITYHKDTNKKALYNQMYSPEGMKLFASSLFKDFAKYGFISTKPPTDKKLIINDKPYIIDF